MKEKILFLGDLLYDYDHEADDLKEFGAWIHENNYQTVLNLEGGLFYDPSCKIGKRGKHLYSHDTTLDILKTLRCRGVCLSNNHTMDFGRTGLERTLSLLDDAGFNHAGAGMNLEEALKPLVLQVEGHRVFVFNYGWDEEETVYAGPASAGCAPRNKEIILSAVQECFKEKDAEDRIVVCIHWGFEYNRLPQLFDIDLGHAMIDAGSDLVIGHHPHVIQPKETYNGKRIYYSLGNFYVASKRIRYKRQFSDSIPNQSDFGVGVIWNPDTLELEEVLLQFDRKTETTSIIAAPELEDSDIRTLSVCLEDITGKDYTSAGYLKEVKARKQNINPILGLNEKENQKLLSGLERKRKIRRLIKKILRK